MPELPEVETIVRDLRPLLVGRRLTSVTRVGSLELRRPWLEDWHGGLVECRILEARRRGKWILLGLDSGGHLVVHLGMTGRLLVVAEDAPQEPHTHLVFDLDDPGRQLRFSDIRRFGCAVVIPDDAALEAFHRDNALGPEPFDLDPAAWRASLKATTRVIKAVLLDQTVVAGVGNIYADEALFQARLHPGRRACGLKPEEADRLREAIVHVLTEAIEHRGSTIRNYVGGSGLAGGYQDEFRAYGRTGLPCSRCETPIAMLRVGGRSSHFCPQCQPAPRKARAKKH